MEELYTNNIIRAKKGSIYKGHTLLASSTNSKIQIHNTYFDVTISETYDADTNQTTSLTHWVKTNPKWLINLVDNEISDIKFKTYFDNNIERNGNKLDIRVNPTYTVYTVEYTSPGIAFKTPTDNISQIKRFKKIFSAFHSKLKKAGTSINNYKLVDSPNSSITNQLSERFFNEFDIALATEIKGLPF